MSVKLKPVMSLSIKARLILLLVMILLPSFLGISLLNYRSTRDSILESLVSTTLPLIRDSFYRKLQLELRDPVLLSSLMANDTFLQNWILEGEKDIDAVVSYLDAIKKKYGFSSSFFVSAKTMQYYTPGGILKTVTPQDSHDTWYYDFLDLNREYDLDVDTDQAAQDRLTIFINYRVEKGTDLLGVTGVGIAMNQIAATLEDLRDEYGALVYIVDSSGTIQAHPDIQTIINTRLQDIPGLDKNTDALLQPTLDPLDFTYMGLKGEVLLTVQYIKDLDWYIVVEQNEEDALRKARHTLKLDILITVVGSLLVILLSILVVNHYQSRLEQLSQTDKLTGINNRRQLDFLLEKEIHRSVRFERTLSVIMADLDHFKKVNDTYGHLQGDLVLRNFARLLTENIRSIDTPGRWGGEEFLLILPETDRKGAYLLAEQIRQALLAADLTPVKGLTVSLGTAELQPDDTIETLTRRADEALYRAKEEGRNRTVSDDGLTGGSPV